MEVRINSTTLRAWADKADRRKSVGIVIRESDVLPGELVVGLQNRQGR